MDECGRSGSSFRGGDTRTDLVDEGHEDTVDAVLLWCRADDGDLTDTLVDTQEDLEVPGAVFLLTPQQGVEGFVEPAGITTAAKTARLTPAMAMAISKERTATRLNTPKRQPPRMGTSSPAGAPGSCRTRPTSPRRHTQPLIEVCEHYDVVPTPWEGQSRSRPRRPVSLSWSGVNRPFQERS
ncbi:DUF3052 domain-containing protein [Streptomyces sp. NBC_01239]|uniref:DUF3052 family protein n=1 Tax=Streptomyces sp. NBC_01239 TaxID=2903792 RepID=UPI0022537065|nr:DUF3052 family protein [Streptomyces sp. NBC_01239]MCX4816375.1 DUF3052 domain-containing protein [Streptomyces sp. NBC_01239]